MFYFITALVLLAKELGFFFELKKLIHKKDYFTFRKPYDCFFCLSVWANTLLLIVLLTFNYQSYHFTNFGVVILLTKIIDLLWNKD